MPLLPRSRRGTWLLAAAVWLAACGLVVSAGWLWWMLPNTVPSHSSPEFSVGGLFHWLRQMPDDNSHRHSGKKLTWNEWVAAGRLIPDLESRLVRAFEPASPIMKVRIAIAMYEFGSARSLNVLIQALQTGEPSLQMRCAAALGHIGQDAAVDSLVVAAKSPDKNVRGNAVVSLGRIGGSKAEQCIRSTLADECEFVRSCAVEAQRLLKVQKSWPGPDKSK
jgi:hypothetical protein